MQKLGTGVPRGDMKLDDAVAGDSKRGQSCKVWAGAIGKIVGWRDRDKPFLALQRTQALADAPMSRHFGKCKTISLKAHNP